jgi:hypothetical protein
MPLVGFSIKRG